MRGDTNCKIYMKGVGRGFGYVPPVAIPLEEVLKGLPEPDMIVTDGENAPPSSFAQNVHHHRRAKQAVRTCQRIYGVVNGLLWSGMRDHGD